MTQPNPWQAPEQPVPAPALPQAGEEQPVTGCSFKDAIIRYWKGYVRFRGRASRSEYWWAMLFTFLVWFAFSLLDQSGSGLGALFSLLSACWGLGPSGAPGVAWLSSRTLLIRNIVLRSANNSSRCSVTACCQS